MVERPIEVPYKGRKNGGTKRGKMATAVPISSRMNRTSLNSALEREFASQYEENRKHGEWTAAVQVKRLSFFFAPKRLLRRASLERQCRREVDCRHEESDNPECPCERDAFEELARDDGKDGATDTRAGIDEAGREVTPSEKVLRR